MVQIETDIVARCQRGEKEAFRWVVQKYQRMVFSLALKMLCDEEEAKDMVQETFIRVWQSIRNYDPQKTFSTWVYTIASRLCIDRFKKSSRMVVLPEDEITLRRFASDTDSQQSLENREWVSIVRMIAEGLSDKQRLVFTLCQLEGIPSAEVEQITGLDAKQVKSNLYVARQTIRKRLKELGYDSKDYKDKVKETGERREEAKNDAAEARQKRDDAKEKYNQSKQNYKDKKDDKDLKDAAQDEKNQAKKEYKDAKKADKSAKKDYKQDWLEISSVYILRKNNKIEIVENVDKVKIEENRFEEITNFCNKTSENEIKCKIWLLLNWSVYKLIKVSSA